MCLLFSDNDASDSETEFNKIDSPSDENDTSVMDELSVVKIYLLQ